MYRPGVPGLPCCESCDEEFEERGRVVTRVNIVTDTKAEPRYPFMDSSLTEARESENPLSESVKTLSSLVLLKPSTPRLHGSGAVWMPSEAVKTEAERL